ncbi:MAG: hypothetical protein F6K21_04495 [Symploca sp. SIO2D2]|nr:hypothetical protein [Symploca sp. SIO2D2]
MHHSILRTEENGVEYFTVVETGESAVSERGLSRMSGVSRRNIQRWFADLAHTGSPKWLSPLQHLPLSLAHEIKKNGRKIKPIPSKTASKFISLVARNLKTDEALDTLDAIADIGLTSYIQNKTGWLPERYKAAPQAHKAINRIMDKPRPFHPLFGDKNVQAVADLLKCSRNCPKIAKWFWEYVYCTLTPEEVSKLDCENPVLENGHRKDTIHQWLEENATVEHKQYFDDVLQLLKLSQSELEFEEFWRRKYERVYQLSFVIGG